MCSLIVVVPRVGLLPSKKSLALPSPFVVIMKVFCLNIRGLNSRSRQSFLKSWVVKNKPILGSVLETHVSEENVNQILNCTFPG